MTLDRSNAWNRAYRKSKADWDPKDLPAFPLPRNQVKATPRATALAELIAAVFFTGLWLTPFWNGGPILLNTVEISASPVWMSARWMMLTSGILSMGTSWFGLVRPYSVLPRERLKLVIDLLNLLTLAVLLFANEWIILRSAGITPAALAGAVQWANFGIRIGLEIGAVVTCYAIIDRTLRLLRKPQREPSPLAPSTTV